MNKLINQSQRLQFERDGYLVIRGAVGTTLLDQLSDQVERWIEDSRSHSTNFGETEDGKARFDLDPCHTKDKPLLRRVANPVDISAEFRELLLGGDVVTMVADLIGPDVKFHHCKLNNKPPHSGVEVQYHQDHPFDPHSNDDVVVALVMLDDMTPDNGCLHVVPGSHKQKFSHFDGDRFVGRLAPKDYEQMAPRAIPITGKRGDLVLQHTWLVHGGDVNRTDRSRRMIICDYTAADAAALTPAQMPSKYTGHIVAGVARTTPRVTQHDLELPPKYEDDSFFGVQQADPGHDKATSV